MHYKTIIISDVHMGIPDSRYKGLLLRLQKQTFDQLIFNGDIVDGLYMKLFSRRKNQYTQRFESIQQLTTEQNAQLTYIRGNHDDFIQHPLKQHMYNDVLYEGKDKRFYICHGHQFGEVAGKYLPLLYITFSGVCAFYRFNRQFNSVRKLLGLPPYSLIKIVKRVASSIMVGGNKKFHKSLIKTTKEHGADGIICGHTHEAGDKLLGNYRYINTDDWIESCTAVVEHTNGDRELIQTIP